MDSDFIYRWSQILAIFFIFLEAPIMVSFKFDCELFNGLSVLRAIINIQLLIYIISKWSVL